MQSTMQSRNGLVQRLDTSYTSFDGVDGIRSPRTPTYVPESLITASLVPFDHAKFLDKADSNPAKRPSTPPPPEILEAWIWTCHLCHSRYPLGVTRRCLVDGHYYCSGETDRPSLRKRKKQRSCSSEFDYYSWKMYGEWRRDVLQSMKNPTVLKGCDYCDFPSQCRSVQAYTFSEPEPPRTQESQIASALNTTSTVEEAGVSDNTNCTPMEPVTLGQVLNDAYSELNQGKDGSKKYFKTSSKRPAKDPIATPSGHTVEAQAMLIPSLQEEMDKEAIRLREFVGMDIWGELQDIELGKTKVE